MDRFQSEKRLKIFNCFWLNMIYPPTNLPTDQLIKSLSFAKYFFLKGNCWCKRDEASISIDKLTGQVIHFPRVDSRKASHTHTHTSNLYLSLTHTFYNFSLSFILSIRRHTLRILTTQSYIIGRALILCVRQSSETVASNCGSVGRAVASDYQRSMNRIQASANF